MNTRLSKIGTWLSVGCAVHCMLMPILMVLLPLFSLMAFMKNQWLEWALMGSAIVLSTAGMCWGYKTHKRLMPLFVVLAGAAMMILGHLTGHEFIFPLIGGSCFVAANYLNAKFCKTCGCCHK